MIAVPADVFAELQRDPRSPVEEELAARKIEVAQAQLESHLMRSVERREFTETLRVRRGAVVVSRGPIVSVTSVGVAGSAAPWWEVLDRETIYVAALDGAVVEVVYEGGWPEDMTAPAKDAVVSRVARFLNRDPDRSTGVKSESVEGDGIRRSLTWADDPASGDGFLGGELECCSALKLRL